METVYTFDKHRVDVFDDYYLFVANGDILEDHAKKIIEIAVKHFGDKPYFILGDLTHIGSINPAARKYLAESAGSSSAGAALWGASFQTRVIANLLLNAINLIKKHAIPSTFFKTEAEARSWLDQRRKEIKH